MSGLRSLLKGEVKGVNRKVIGKHVYGSLFECDPDILSDAEYLTEVVINAAKEGNMTLLDVKYWKIHPGVSLVAIILESHITIHTWPEYSFATVDVYSCGERSDPEASFLYIAKALRAKSYSYDVIDRSFY